MYFYNKQVPNVGDLVIVNISEYPEKKSSVKCELIEYNNMYGILLLTEITKKKITDPKKIFKNNKKYVMLVLDVHTNDNNTSVDLSYVKVNDTDKEKQMNDFIIKENILVFSLEMSKFCNIDLNTVLNFTMWKFMDNKKILENIEAFYNEALENPCLLSYYFPEEYKKNCEKYIENLKTRIEQTDEIAVKYFNLIVFNSINDMSNLETLKWCLSNGLDSNSKEYEIIFNSPSKYSIISRNSIKNKSSINIEYVSEIIKNNIKNVICNFSMDELCKITEKKFNFKKLSLF